MRLLKVNIDKYIFLVNTNFKNYINDILILSAIHQRSYRFVDDIIKNQILEKSMLNINLGNTQLKSNNVIFL